MSFFSKGFSSMVNERHLKKAAKRGSRGKAAGKQDKKDDTKDEGRWDRLTDAYGRTYWQHSVTGEWSYGVGGGLVLPVGVVNPSTIVGYPGAVFIPSPVFAAPPPSRREDKPAKKKDEDKKEGKGWWETIHDDDGDRYWEHTVTKKITYKDPYY